MMDAYSPGTRDHRCVVARSDSLAGRRRWQGFVPKSLSLKCNNRPPASWFMTAGRSICSKVDSLTLQATPESRRKHRTARQSKPTNRDGLAHVGFAPRHALALPASVRHFLEHSKCVFGLCKRAHAWVSPGAAYLLKDLLVHTAALRPSGYVLYQSFGNRGAPIRY